MPDIARARTLTYSGPRRILLTSIALDVVFQMRAGQESDRLWRERRTRSAHYLRQAALYCWGRKVLNSAHSWGVSLWPDENSPVDAVLRCQTATGEESYEFVQLKEIVPEVRNPTQSIQALLDSLPERYPDAGGFTIAIHINRDLSTLLSSLRMPTLRDGKVWFFGTGGEPPFNAFLIGDFMQPEELRGCFFEHPRFAPGQSLLSLTDISD